MHFRLKFETEVVSVYVGLKLFSEFLFCFPISSFNFVSSRFSLPVQSNSVTNTAKITRIYATKKKIRSGTLLLYICFSEHDSGMEHKGTLSYSNRK